MSIPCNHSCPPANVPYFINVTIPFSSMFHDPGQSLSCSFARKIPWTSRKIHAALQKTASLPWGPQTLLPFRPWTSFWIWLSSFLSLFARWDLLPSSTCRGRTVIKKQCLKSMDSEDKLTGLDSCCSASSCVALACYLAPLPQFPPKKKSGNCIFSLGSCEY